MKITKKKKDKEKTKKTFAMRGCWTKANDNSTIETDQLKFNQFN